MERSLEHSESQSVCMCVWSRIQGGGGDAFTGNVFVHGRSKLHGLGPITGCWKICQPFGGRAFQIDEINLNYTSTVR